MAAESLAAAAEKFALSGCVYDGVNQAFAAARAAAASDDLVLVTGSVFTVAEVL
jgi:folylpolyglutamate synthase/dihydropteroate synthase